MAAPTDEHQPRRPPGLHRASVKGLFTGTIVVLGGLALGAAISMHLVTSRAERATGLIVEEITTIQALAQLEANLFVYSRSSLLFEETGEARFQAMKESARTKLLANLDKAEALSSAEERIALQNIRELVSWYLSEEASLAGSGLAPARQMIASSPHFNATLSALHKSVAVSSESAEATRLRLEKLSDLVTTIATGAIVVLALAIIIAMIAARRGVFRSFGTLHKALFAYSSGDTDARAPEDGPIELQAMARAFNVLASSLEQQRRNRFEFLLAVAHDLRNPLAALKVTVALAESRAKSGDLSQEQVNQQQRRISRQVDRLNRMVEDLVDVTRVEAGRFDLSLATTDLRELLLETREIFAEASTLHSISLHLPALPVPVRCDETRLGQVMNNLVSNAIKYSPGGGEVVVRLLRQGSQAIVEVEDQGVGIAPAEYARIFEPFQRVVQDEIPGVGLGLSVAKRLVEAHQGHIEVDSERGVGSTFRVVLRVAPATDGAGSSERESGVVELEPQQVALAE